jgi:dihydrofolate reductase
MKTYIFIAASLDGYIARADGNIDWLMAATPPGDQHGYGEFIAQIDTIVMGRKTFETVLGFDDWPYDGKRVIILSRTLAAIPARLSGKAELHRGPVRELHGALAAGGCHGLYIDGGQTVQSFLRESLVDELTLTCIPILLGSGIPLFGALPDDLPLQHVATRVIADSLVQSSYTFKKPAR